MKARIVALTCALALASPVPAFAQAQDPAVAPPGNSAVDQYRESVPPTSPGGRGPTRGEAKALARQGEDGRRLAEVLERTAGVPSGTDDDVQAGAPGGSSGGGRASGGGGTSGARADGGVAASTPDGSASSATSDPAPVAVITGGIGPIPIWLMAVLAVLLIVGVNVVRQRRAS